MITDGTIDGLARIDALHTGLTQIVLEGGDLVGIADEVSRALDVGVVVTSTDGRQRAAALTDAHLALLEAHELIEPTGRIRVERVVGAAAAVGSGEVLGLRVAAGGADLARLVCVRVEGPITSDDVHALERAAAVAALLITRQEAITAVENKYQGDFLRDMLLRRAVGPEYVTEHVETFGWELGLPLVVVAAEIDPPPADEPAPDRKTRRHWQERFAAAWRQVCDGLGDGIPTVDFSSEVVSLLPVVDGQEIVAKAVTAVAGDKGGGRRSFSVGVSRPAQTLDDLPEAYAQARRAVDVGRRMSGGGATTYFDQLGLHRLIALVPDVDELRAFTRDALGTLADATPEAADLRETLQVLLDTNFNVAEAARAQFFHYNTMRYRVSKLEKMLGPIASDPHLRLDVAVALRILEITK